MVSFQCENCGDVLTKKKLDPHRGRCRGATFSCIDCMVHFYGTEYRSHTACMTEDQKYQGALYKDSSNNKNKNKKARINPPNSAEQDSNNLFHPTPAAVANTNTSTNAKPEKMAAVAHLPHNAYVEDVPEELEAYLVPDDDDNASRSDDDAPPHAPTPPPVSEGPVNVFDFLDTSATPNASNLALPQVVNPQTERYHYDANDVNDFIEANEYPGKQQLVHYDAAASMAATNAVQFQTPAPVSRDRERERERERKKKSDKDAKDKKDKKRKRLFLEINDQVMVDAPPVLHSGLTGGLSRLSTKHAAFLPSPALADTPASPLKKSKSSSSKHKSKRHSSDSVPAANGIFSILSAGSKKSKKRKDRRSSSPASGEKKKHRSSRHRDTKDAKDKKDAPKLLEYHPSDKKDDAATAAAAGQMIIYKPRADLFLSFVNKGPDSDRGCSMNKALKRFHRERSASGTSLAKPAEEKELFRSLRLRKNDRGEIVLFCVEDEE